MDETIEEPTAPLEEEEAAEAGELEPEPEPEPEEEELEPAAESEQAISDKEIEKVYKALERLRDSHAARVSKILGDESIDLDPCPVCSDFAPGFVWKREVAPLDEAKVPAVRLLLGMEAQATLSEHKNFVACEACEGYGTVLTGSQKPGYETSDCPDCFGRGWNSPGMTVPPMQTDGQQPQAPPPVLTGPTAPGLPPEAQALKDAGWIVAPPFNPQQTNQGG